MNEINKQVPEIGHLQTEPTDGLQVELQNSETMGQFVDREAIAQQEDATRPDLNQLETITSTPVQVSAQVTDVAIVKRITNPTEMVENTPGTDMYNGYRLEEIVGYLVDSPATSNVVLLSRPATQQTLGSEQLDIAA